MTKFIKNNKRLVYCVDVDGTLTNGEPFWEGEPTPNQEMIDAVISKYHQGNIIIIWTARQWECAPETIGWLTKHKIPFHGIQMSKGGADAYVDDKSVSLNSFLGIEKKEQKIKYICDEFEVEFNLGEMDRELERDTLYCTSQKKNYPPIDLYRILPDQEVRTQVYHYLVRKGWNQAMVELNKTLNNHFGINDKTGMQIADEIG